MPCDHSTESACPLRDMLLTVPPGELRADDPRSAKFPSCEHASSILCPVLRMYCSLCSWTTQGKSGFLGIKETNATRFRSN